MILAQKFHLAAKLFTSLGIILIIIGCGGGKESSALDGPADVMAVYKANCVNCHGTELQGKIGPKTNLQEVAKRMSAADITGQIELGGETMPPFKDRLTDEQIAGLAEWLSGKNKAAAVRLSTQAGAGPSAASGGFADLGYAICTNFSAFGAG